MKKSLLIAFMAIVSIFAQAQTKGTSTIGFGFSHYNYSQKFEGNSFGNQQKASSLNLGYGLFVNENEKVGFTFLFGKNKYGSNSSETTSNLYGGDLSYQKYYPLFKKFYAYAGGRLGYSKDDASYQSGTTSADYITNNYSVGAYGGLSFFVSKRFAFEANLLSANVGYSKATSKEFDPSQGKWKTETTSFNLSSQGAINNLGFKIYFLF